jgi:hypothetical protein
MPAPDVAGVRYAEGAPWFDSSYSRFGCLYKKIPKRESEEGGHAMRRPHPAREISL